MSSAKSSYDVVIVGGGHNSLVAATYLSRAGLSVLMLERLDHVGGVAGSRYADLRGPMPERLVSDLGLGLDLRTTAPFRDVGSSTQEHAAWERFRSDLTGLVSALTPTLLRPLPLEQAVREQVDAEVWRDFVVRPLGETIEARFADDTIRGVAAAAALTGAFTSMHSSSLAQNRGLLYHLLGAGAGERRVVAGGMRAAVDALVRAAQEAGAEVLTSAGVSRIDASHDGAEVVWDEPGGRHGVRARWVLSGVAAWVLQILLGQGEDPATKPVGALMTIDLRLERLPRLLSDDTVAGADTVLHLNQGYAQLEAAYDDAAAGRVPTELPGRVTFHDRDGLTLTFVGLDTPGSLFVADPDGARDLAVQRALAALEQHLVEPIGSCLSSDAVDAAGRSAIEVRIPQDIERELALPGGHLLHGDLEWPWASNRARLDSPAQQWGVQTDIASVLICGSGSRRGGVSGLGGHSAAQAVLGSL